MMKLSIKRIVSAALLVGTLDITAACLQYYFRTGKGPDGVLRFVASGLFGKAAFTSGTSMIVAGLVIHYIIAMAFTVLFFLLVKNTALLRRTRLVTGVLYGVFVWTIMNVLVLPITNAPPLPRTVSRDLQAMAILILCIGLPLSFSLIPNKEK